MYKQCSSCGLEKHLSAFEPTRNKCTLCRSMQKKVRKFNITVGDYNRMFAEQEGCCAICHKHQSDFDKALAIDHDHKTGEVRGLLCMHCNTALGKFNDNTELLHSAIKYLGTSNRGFQDLSPSSVEPA